ncbi:MAG: YeiH family protein [Beutenbergiaceae bacterium]
MEIRVTGLLPGLLIVAVAAIGAYLAHALLPAVHPTTWAVVLGVVTVNAGLVRPSFAAGLRFASRVLLRIAVALLGLSLSLTTLAQVGWSVLAVVLATVIVAFGGTLLITRWLRCTPATGLLTATGVAICGASAIAAMEPFAKGKREDTAVAVAIVTLCGSIAILVLPVLAHPLGLNDPVQFGQWVGASVHDVGQTVAAASMVPGALSAAVVVKLTRVLLLAPLVLGVGFAMRTRRSGAQESQPKPPLVPLFVGMFVAAVLARTLLPIPDVVLGAAAQVQGGLLTAAMFALGTGIRWQLIRVAGLRSIAAGLLAWLLVAAVAYAGVTMVG